ncbi:uncharacterized protein LOC133037168 [Cannabis sativa]|uniref:uncharacterized protein LOC133037168 n=1 Tax=Cannabis sativa TaxID=3483 RepID=UPI0029CA82B7|nr:uncharacterized protein LOC133037168 [Cannabis sativa]
MASLSKELLMEILSNNNNNGPSICNPCTRKYTKLLPYDNSTVPIVIGFGYDPLIDDHKLLTYTVKILDEIDISCSLCEFQLYCVKAKTWKKVNCNNNAFVENYGYELFGYANVENCLYWIVNPRLKKDNISFIFGFDLQTEKHSELALPFDHNDEASLLMFGPPVGLEGCLCVTRRVIDTRHRWKFEIWGVKVKNYDHDHDDHNKQCWSLMFTLVPDHPSRFLCYFDIILPIKNFRSTNQLLLDVNHKLFLYDLETESTKPLHVPLLDDSQNFEAFLGVQSLL